MGRQLDEPHLFHVRNEALTWQSRIRKAPNRGFTGGRVDLIEHQLYLAQEVASRLQPRVLLADEVGLGKTIEACLILHRLHLTGRAERALIILPESLMHQWFIELLRRFNLLASLFDEERCQAIEGADPDVIPFSIARSSASASIISPVPTNAIPGTRYRLGYLNCGRGPPPRMDTP